MERQFKNLLGYYEDIIAEGDQGETHAAIDRIIQKHSHYIKELKDMFLNEIDEDRKEILGGILWEYDIEEVTLYMRDHGLD